MKRFSRPATIAAGGTIGGIVSHWFGAFGATVLTASLMIGTGVALLALRLAVGRLDIPLRDLPSCLLHSALAGCGICLLYAWAWWEWWGTLHTPSMWAPSVMFASSVMFANVGCCAMVMAPVSIAADRLRIPRQDLFVLALSGWAGYTLGDAVQYSASPVVMFAAGADGLLYSGYLPAVVRLIRSFIRQRAASERRLAGAWRRFRQNPHAELLHIGLRLLPTPARERYYREWLADLTILAPSDRRQFTLSLLLIGIPLMAIRMRMAMLWRAPWGS
jgi:hypothetical protein